MARPLWILRIALVLGVICAATSSPDAEDMAQDLSEAKEEVEEVKDDAKDVKTSGNTRKDMWANFETLMVAYNRENRRLLAHNTKMARDIDDSRMGIKFGVAVIYKVVPNFVLRNDARPTNKPTTSAGCEVYCNSRPSCQSFSYNKVTMVCLLSGTKLRYSPTTVMYLKKELGEGDPAHAYQIIPGLSGDSVPIPGMNSAKKPFSECKYECTKAGKDCTAFVYDKKNAICLNTAGESGWDPAFTYNEKVKLDPNKKEKELQGRENDFKEKIRTTWRAENKEAAFREAVTHKEVVSKCKFTKGEAKKFVKKADHYHQLVRVHKAAIDTIRVITWKNRNDLDKTSSILNRAKTTRMDATAEKELLSKQGERVTTPKEIKPIYDQIAVHSARLVDAANKIRDNTIKFKTLDKKRKDLYAQRQKKQSILKKDKEERDVNKAMAVMSEAEFKERCGVAEKDKLKDQVKEEKLAAKVDEQIAAEAEKDAAVKKKAAEKANKAAESTKGTGESQKLEKQAQKAGRAADRADSDSKTKTKNELKVLTKKDKLKMKLELVQTEKNKWANKVKTASTYLRKIEAKRDAEADAAFEKKMADPAR